MLRKRAFDERSNVGRRVADRLETVRRLQPLHVPRQPVGKNLSASFGAAFVTSAPSTAAASRWRGGFALAVKQNTAGALRITQKPCGMIDDVGRAAFGSSRSVFDVGRKAFGG
jgi:hypothetical protein